MKYERRVRIPFACPHCTSGSTATDGMYIDSFSDTWNCLFPSSFCSGVILFLPFFLSSLHCASDSGACKYITYIAPLFFPIALSFSLPCCSVPPPYQSPPKLLPRLPPPPPPHH